MSPDPSRRALIKTVASTRFPILSCLTLSSVPTIYRPYDVLVLPAGPTLLDEELISRSRSIAYGPIEFMPQAFLLGCVDYLAEPWHPEELFYRALRLQTPQRFSLKGIEFLILTGGIQTEKCTVPMSAIEYSLLLALVKAKGTIVPRTVLAQLIPGPFSEPNSRRLDAHMARLRKKIRLCLPSHLKTNLRSNASTIRSARGLGYYLITD